MISLSSSASESSYGSCGEEELAGGELERPVQQVPPNGVGKPQRGVQFYALCRLFSLQQINFPKVGGGAIFHK